MVNSTDQPTKIFFHVGLERTGTTFLQRKVFPHFKGLRYIPKKQYLRAPEIIRTTPQKTVLVSHEFNRGFADAMRAFRKTVEGDIYPIIVLRRHDKWLLSLYKRDLKNGKICTLSEFTEHHLNADALDFCRKIKLLRETFNDPLVLFYEELVTAPEAFISKMADFIATTPDWDKINLTPVHTSYSDHQLSVLYHTSELIRWHFLHSNKIFRYTILSLANLLPREWFRKKELFPKRYLEQTRRKYAKDWEDCLALIAQSR
jgi:hypothetical protein